MIVEQPPARRARLITHLAVALTIGPLIVDPRIGQDRLFAYSAADAFYYLQVARNSAHGSISFDRTHATNGFHPLWQLILTVLYRVTSWLGLRDIAIMWVSTAGQLVLLGGATWLVATALRRAHDDHLTAWFLIWPLGFYAIVFAPFWVWGGAFASRGVNPLEGPMPLYGTVWSYLNGMETPLVLAALGLLLWRVTVHDFRGRRSAMMLGTSLALLALSRLDTVFVSVAVVVTLLVLARARKDRALQRFGRASAVVLSAVLGAYLAVNRLYAGAALPVSGSLKSTFPRPTLGNWRDLWSLATGNSAYATLRLYRHGPIVISTVVALAFLATVGRRTWRDLDRTTVEGVDDVVVEDDRTHRNDPLALASVRYRLTLSAIAVGVIALSAYDEFFVPGNHQGHWYWPVSTAFVTLATLEWIQDRTRGRHRPAHRAQRPTLERVGIAALVVVVLAGFVAFSAPDRYHERFAAFAQTGAPALRAAAHTSGTPKIIELDDGVDAWFLGFPALSGTGLTLDRRAVQAYEHGTFLDLALRRGYDRLVSLAYLDATGLTRTTPSDVIRDRLAAMLPGPDLAPYRFSVERRLPQPLPTAWPGSDGSYVVIRIRRR